MGLVDSEKRRALGACRDKSDAEALANAFKPLSSTTLRLRTRDAKRLVTAAINYANDGTAPVRRVSFDFALGCLVATVSREKIGKVEYREGDVSDFVRKYIDGKVLGRVSDVSIWADFVDFFSGNRWMRIGGGLSDEEVLRIEQSYAGMASRARLSLRTRVRYCKPERPTP